MFNFPHLMHIYWPLVSQQNAPSLLLAFITTFNNPIIVIIVFLLATSKPFGFIGGGTLFLLNLNENGTIVRTKSFEWSDGLFDTVSIQFYQQKQQQKIELV